MRQRHGRWLVILILVALAGCQGGMPHRNRRNADVVIGEPELGSRSRVGSIPEGAEDPRLVPGNPPRKVQWYDRHPLFRKPREVYEDTNRGPVVNAAAATFVGIPMGIVGEFRQIIVGCPPGF